MMIEDFKRPGIFFIGGTYRDREKPWIIRNWGKINGFTVDYYIDSGTLLDECLKAHSRLAEAIHQKFLRSLKEIQRPNILSQNFMFNYPKIVSPRRKEYHCSSCGVHFYADKEPYQQFSNVYFCPECVDKHLNFNWGRYPEIREKYGTKSIKFERR